jgi:hypothetical protein
MKIALIITYFTFFGFCWPVYLSNRMRGRWMFASMVAPWIAFWMAWFAR